MIIGTLHVRLYLSESTSLKGKRFILKGLKDRLRKRFNISLSEVGDGKDLWQDAELAVAVVGDSAHDIAMARAASAGLAIAVRTGPTPEARLQAADVVLDDIAAFPDWLTGRKSP